MPARRQQWSAHERRVRSDRVAFLLALVARASSATALEIESLEAGVTDGRYYVQLEAVVAAPAERVAGVLSDYANYAALDPRIRASEVIGVTPDGQTLLRTRVRACAGPFCRTVQRTEQVTHEPDRLMARVVPEASDLRGGVTQMRWREEAGRTRVWYQADFEPAFWVPELVARRYASGELRRSVLQLFENVEERSRDR